MKQKVLQLTKEYLMLTVAGILCAIQMNSFILPNTFVPGGISGISSILQFTGLLQAKYGYFLLNIPLLILGLVLLNKDFAIKTVYAAAVCTVFMNILDDIHFFTFTEDRLVAVFMSAIIGGVATHIALDARGSNGGTEIIGRLAVKKNPEADLGNILFGINIFVMGVGGFFATKEKVYDLGTVVYSLLMSFISSSVYRILSFGVDPVLKYTIVTRRGYTLSSELLAKFERGVSAMEVVDLKGNSTDREALTVVIQFRQNEEFKKLLDQHDPDCFAFCVPVENVITRPTFNKRYKRNEKHN